MAEQKTKVKEVRLEPRKIYLKDASFESPMSPAIFAKGEVKPDINVQLTLHHKRLDKDKTLHEVVLQITATSKVAEDALFLIEVHQAGIFDIDCEDAQQLAMIKEVACANILLPFARETVADLVAKGGFHQLLLNPINFEALYAQKMQKQAENKYVPSSDSIN